MFSVYVHSFLLFEASAGPLCRPLLQAATELQPPPAWWVVGGGLFLKLALFFVMPCVVVQVSRSCRGLPSWGVCVGGRRRRREGAQRKERGTARKLQGSQSGCAGSILLYMGLCYFEYAIREPHAQEKTAKAGAARESLGLL